MKIGQSRKLNWKKRHDLGNSLFVEVSAGRNVNSLVLRSCTEVDWRNGARALLVGMCRWQSNSDPSVNSRLNNLIKILPEFALIERNQQVVMKRSESFSPSLFIFCPQFAAIRMTFL